MSLPSGYTQLEYIESTGTQYIDTAVRVMPENYQQLKMSVTCEKIGKGSGVSNWLLDGSSISNACFYTGVYNGKYYYGCGTTDHDTGIAAVSGKQTFTLDIPSAKFTVSDAVDVSISTEAVTASASLYLFGFNYNSIRCYAEKIYSCQIYIGATLVRDFIPCKNASSAVGLYDLVDKQFYGNAGTGTFTAGPVIAIAVDASEITKLEYIESAGTQYIDTGIVASSGFEVEIKLKVNSYNSLCSIIGAHNESSPYGRNYLGITSSHTEIGQCDSVHKYTAIDTDSSHVVLCSNVYNNMYFIVDNVAQSTSGAQSGGTYAKNTLYLFWCHGGAQWFNRFSGRIYYCKITESDTLVRDFIAAKLSDGTVGLYDKLSGLLYINAGTGTFEAGPSSLNLPVNIGGTWKDANEAFANIGGTWKTVKAAFVNIDGTWKELS